ncbi:FecR family protein [Mucilaginibacter aquariorum]|uniref:FecR domain-containing protein n=1 Tax=Mucilaginibacter aquariorum TaxID=2967225 RepID=A0ABT1SZN6_9SPHI|nr:FecR domain-containing protein [Mucilaginibacter aquariorum]MCQ6957799.1 FecR domain-containing protein [Mucilaginibacter aquariorum]
MNQQDRKSELLEKYMNNTCTKQEFDEFMELIKTSTDFEDFDGPMKKHWEGSPQENVPDTVDWNRMYSNIKLRLWALKKTKVLFKFAAVIVLVISACTLIIYNYNKVASGDHIVYLTQHAGVAKTKVILLSDGTRVTLNANSDLRYPQNFNAKTREVYLKGEAYFEVIHNENKPFVIHSGRLKTHVLGTTFTVSAYSQVKPMNVTVLTGKVAVKDELNQAHVILTRGQSASTKDGKNTFEVITLANPEDAIAWMDDKMIFENSDLESVALKLSYKYGVDIKVTGDKLSQQHITAIFQGQTLPGILKAITQLTHSNYKVRNNAYILY